MWSAGDGGPFQPPQLSERLSVSLNTAPPPYLPPIFATPIVASLGFPMNPSGLSPSVRSGSWQKRWSTRNVLLGSARENSKNVPPPLPSHEYFRMPPANAMPKRLPLPSRTGVLAGYAPSRQRVAAVQKLCSTVSPEFTPLGTIL